MRRIVPWALVPLLAASGPAQSSVPLSPAVQYDVQCFILYSIAVDTAVKAKDDKTQEAASLGVMYFVGKLTVESPGLNLADAVRQETNGMSGNPRAKEIGAACDAEFAKRAQELLDISQQLQTVANQSSSSS
jgi:hypothetical protein